MVQYYYLICGSLEMKYKPRQISEKEYNCLCDDAYFQALAEGYKGDDPEFHEQYVLTFLGTSSQDKMIIDWISSILNRMHPYTFYKHELLEMFRVLE